MISVKQNREGGFSLIGAMILLGVIGIIIFAWARSHSAQVKVQNLVRSKRGALDAKQLIEAEIMQIFRANTCFSPASDFADVPVSSIGRLAYSTTVHQGITFDRVQETSLDARINEAKTRCQTPRLTGTTGSVANSHRYFCLRLEPGSNAAAGNLFSRAGGFAEIYVETRDFHTGQAVACGDAATGNSGAFVLYSLYWPAATADGLVWQSQTGSFLMSPQ